ncbi:MAG: hypothetical protein FWG63_11065 [Defluviitaleaceae bacterium]|nr:hypothetical protein [Defluviitaleaceae bacterium]
MASEIELVVLQKEKLFDLLEIEAAKTEEERLKILQRQIMKAETAMKKEDVALVRENIEAMKKA